MGEVEQIRSDFGNTKKRLEEARKKLNLVKEMTFDEWQMNKRQLSIDFPNQ